MAGVSRPYSSRLFPPTAYRRALREGAVCFLHKPFDGQTLIKYLKDALSKSDVG
jgi:DNA-binding NtrC family response regulator